MPLPKPKKDESQDKFISRCLGNDTMKSEFPGQSQRAAVCHSQWDKKKNNESQEMSDQMQTFAALAAAAQAIRNVEHEGVDHIIVPIIALVEGVIRISSKF